MSASRLFAAVLVALASPAFAQDAAPSPTIPAATVAAWQDRPLEWRSYDGGTRRATATVYANVGRDRERVPFAVVVAADPSNRAPITDDAQHLAEIVGRALGADPAGLAFLFRFRLEGDARPLTVRATFRRSSAGRLSVPAWRVLSPEEVEDYTDRALR